MIAAPITREDREALMLAVASENCSSTITVEQVRDCIASRHCACEPIVDAVMRVVAKLEAAAR